MAYEVLAARRQQWDALLWQVPALSLTGQAFLLVIALGDTSAALARYLAAGLGFLLALVSVVTLASHRTTEVSDAHIMRDLEKRLGIVPVSGPVFKEQRDKFRRSLKNSEEAQKRKGLSRLVFQLPEWIVWVSTRGRAYPVWLYTFIAFGLVQLAVIVVTTWWPDLL